ncbi:lysylphosphatidylglycerol synthase transmembrane domain-containing protein [Thiohalorhabdus methylotrophus]|uniref:Lysylphosphatidylglycerol synthase transmembrane domain-containing protein n=1 Tax=Thiohalorhabdus methylotrophus TaxID=3242694 RepID=A0ABV4TVJ2_9GAMM
MSAAAKLLARLAFLAGALYLLLNAVDLPALKQALSRASPLWLGVALILFNASQVLSAGRLQVLLHPVGAVPRYLEQLRLYYAGMFCNLYLPGGIGGDGLKAYWLKRRFGVGLGSLIRALLLDRASGLAALLALACLLGTVWSGAWYWLLLGLGGLLVYPALADRLFPRFRGTAPRALALSLGIQGLQGGSAWALMQALDLDGVIYLLLFFLSGIAALAPVTVGGLGARELIYLYGLSWTGHPPGGGIALGLFFFAITGLSSLAGWPQTGRFLRTHKAGESDAAARGGTP